MNVLFRISVGNHVSELLELAFCLTSFQSLVEDLGRLFLPSSETVSFSLIQSHVLYRVYEIKILY